MSESADLSPDEARSKPGLGAQNNSDTDGSPAQPSADVSPNRRRLQGWATAAFLLLAIFAVAARYFLFSQGILYGETAARMASLMVAGIIIAAGYIPLRMLRGSNEARDVPRET